MAAADIQEKTVGKLCLVDVYTDSYEKKVQNKDTGLDDVEIIRVNRIKNFKQLHSEQPNNDINDLGI